MPSPISRLKKNVLFIVKSLLILGSAYFAYTLFVGFQFMILVGCFMSIGCSSETFIKSWIALALLLIALVALFIFAKRKLQLKWWYIAILLLLVIPISAVENYSRYISSQWDYYSKSMDELEKANSSISAIKIGNAYIAKPSSTSGSIWIAVIPLTVHSPIDAKSVNTLIQPKNLGQVKPDNCALGYHELYATGYDIRQKYPQLDPSSHIFSYASDYDKTVILNPGEYYLVKDYYYDDFFNKPPAEGSCGYDASKLIDFSMVKIEATSQERLSFFEFAKAQTNSLLGERD